MRRAFLEDLNCFFNNEFVQPEGRCRVYLEAAFIPKMSGLPP
ncbi:hypothetical protein ACPOL_0435 [Acidisarcina polymorpha]|uniref:Uncharacterized protein n=1 Tax=Acidisarcina polymorpha TaxID=2211140 RepID=A0A2Z5FSS3_9BACT|nr:hypothetical protein ACPOL_0435 [Acidisarcina polymorpha]